MLTRFPSLDCHSSKESRNSFLGLLLPMSTGSFSAYCALTFKHAVEFSSFGCAPRFGFSGRCLGQLDLLYRASWSAVKPAFSALIRSLCSLPAGPARHSSICCCHVPGSHRSDSSNFTEFSARSQTLRFASVESSPLCGGPLLDTHPVCGSDSLSLVGPRPSRILLWFGPRDGVLYQELLRPSRSEGFANVTRRFPMRQIVPGRPE